MIDMQIELHEKNIIYILNCINYTINNLNQAEEYFKRSNYHLYLNDLLIMHRLLSLKGNKYYYNESNNIFFIGQKDYLSSKEKDFEILKYNKKKHKKTNVQKIDKVKFNYFKSKFYFLKKQMDKFKR